MKNPRQSYAFFGRRGNAFSVGAGLIFQRSAAGDPFVHFRRGQPIFRSNIHTNRSRGVCRCGVSIEALRRRWPGIFGTTFLRIFCITCWSLVLSLGFAAQAEEAGCATDYGGPCVQEGSMRGAGPPERVLIVPLLHKGDDPRESERWPEGPAAEIARFYRARFRAQVEWLREVREWSDYYARIDALLRRATVFDRIVFIGHGGFDGPVLDDAVFREGLELSDGVGTLYRGIEAQPGLQRTVTITYDVAHNPAFNDYLAEHWRELVGLDADPVGELRAQEKRLQPLNPACTSHCLSQAGEGGPATCEWVCRDPLFSAESAEKPAPDRFWRFAGGLRQLLAEDGLILIGSCNPGTVAREGPNPWDRDGILMHAALTRGDHPSYVHLLSAATGRRVAGPVGKAGADEIVASVVRLENRSGQGRLRLVVPSPGGPIP